MSQWRPTEILEQVEALSTSTHPIVVETDAGRALLKCIGNPKGPGVLANDYLGNFLSSLLCLPGLEQAIVTINAEVAASLAPTAGKIIAGEALLTRWIDMNPWDGEAPSLASSTGIGDLAMLVAFDTWIMNPDRYDDCTNPTPGEEIRSNMDNLGIRKADTSGHRDLVVFDHGEAFKRGTSLLVLSREIIENRQIFGCFPSFRPYLRVDNIKKACQRIAAIDWNAVKMEIESIPESWSRGTFRKPEAMRLLQERAPFLLTTLPSAIHPFTADAQGSIPFTPPPP